MRKSAYTKQDKVLREQLIAARRAAGMTQQQLADKLKKPQSFVAKFEGGERRLDLIEFLEITEHLGADHTKIIRRIMREG